MDMPGPSIAGTVNETMDINELVERMQKLNAESKLPAELAELLQ